MTSIFPPGRSSVLVAHLKPDGGAAKLKRRERGNKPKCGDERDGVRFSYVPPPPLIPRPPGLDVALPPPPLAEEEVVERSSKRARLSRSRQDYEDMEDRKSTSLNSSH